MDLLNDKLNMKKLFYFPLMAMAIAAMFGFSLIKTQLQVTVRDELGNTVEEVRVRLFETEDDFNTEKNAVREAYTDESGLVKFKELNDISYYVLAEKGDKSNIGGGEMTGKLDAKRINKVTLVIQ